eukprot:m51a1_g6479 hypothetical protein (2880) ;mRNA; r:107787-117893
MGDSSGADDIIPQRGEANSAILNSIVSRYFLRKHSWHGKYNRAFCITPSAVVTLNPATLEVTNSWDVKDIVGATPDPKSDAEFAFAFRKASGRADKMTFSTASRAYLLCDLLQALHRARGKTEAVRTFLAKKLKRSGERKDVTLALYPWALCQVNAITGAPMATYYYHYIEKLLPITDVAGGFVLIYGRLDKRVYMFTCEQREDLLALVQLTAMQSLGVRIGPGGKDGAGAAVPREHIAQVMETLEDDSVFNTVGKFNVLKHTPARHAEPAQRILTLSDKWLVERNPTTYAVVTMRPLVSVSYVVRPPDDPQAFSVHYRDGTSGAYSSSSRESLLACLIDCTRATGNKDALVLAIQLRRGLRMTPIGVPLDASMEAQIVKALSSYVPEAHVGDDAPYFAMLVEMFNANVPYSGPLHVEANRQPRVCVQAMLNILANANSGSGSSAAASPPGRKSPILVQVLHAMRRLVAVRAVFEAFSDSADLRERVMGVVAQGLASADDVCVLASLEVMASLMVPLFELPPPDPRLPPDAPTNARTTEDSNKRLLLGSATLVRAFMSMFAQHVTRGTSPLVIAGCVDILTYVLCEPYAASTDAAQFDDVLAQVAALGRELFKLFHEQHCLSVVRGAGMIMRAIVEEGGGIEDVVRRMQLSALVEGATLKHLHAAFFAKCATQRQALFKELSTRLVALWVSGCPEAESMLSRALPPALAAYLDSTEAPPAEQSAAAAASSPGDARARQAAAEGGKGVVANLWDQWRSHQYPKRPPANPRPRRAAAWAGAQRNWAMLMYQVRQDHARADLVWNNHTREELREALEGELRAFRQEQELASGGALVSWNHGEFIVPYECLSRELNVGGYYIRLLLNPPAPGAKAPPLHNPAEFFDMLFHRCLLERDGELVALCVQALTVVYRYYHKEVGGFRDVAHVVEMLRRATDRLVRDRLLQLVYALLVREDNAKRFIDCGGVAVLVDLLTLVHFNFDHVVAPAASNLITAGAGRAEGEWFYSRASAETGEKERVGPKNLVELRELWASGDVGPATLVWAQGMEDWRALRDVPQLRWALMATGNALLTSVELATLVLDVMYKLCKLYPIRDADGGIIRPVPRPKRQLSSPALLPHLVQVLLTFHPVLVEKTAALLTVVLEDNAAAMPKLYLTGVFYFACMYGGSNVISTVNFLKATHLQQHFGEDEAVQGEMPRRSILGALLPSAMLYHMERHALEEFAQVLLGNYDTPESIWNSDMRAFMVDKIAAHVGNFPQRLSVNPKAVYQYVPIAPVVYKQLEHELFCYRFYLRNFCDEQRFPEWPVDDEVEFVQSALSGWAREADAGSAKPAMSEEEACRTLGIKPGFRDDELRRAYFKLAREYHPDKNPEGRAVFDKILEAYNTLSQSTGALQGRAKCELLMRAQAILYRRFRKELSPFKYAGYALLVETLGAAVEADDRPMLALCSELCYCTVQSSGLNVEELRRQGGLDTLGLALQRCVEHVMPDSTDADDEALAASRIMLTFAAAAAFEECRARIVEGLSEVVRSVLSSPALLPHLVQVLLTFHPVLVEKTAALLTVVLEDNAAAMPKLYLTGVFYFACMYGGSNVISTVNFLKATHLQQHFGEDEAVQGEMPRRSILGALLPSAMLYHMERHALEEFAQVLLGNYDTPESIWNSDMRAFMVDKIAAHVGNFPQRLSVNPKAVYQYVPIAPVVYKQLEHELFCYRFYLRNFCDEQRFPEWPVDDEVEFVQSALSGWAREADAGSAKPAMSEEEACRTLGIKPGFRDDELRRAYFKLAREYHPDKNPEGRAVFDKILEAYNTLSQSTGALQGRAKCELLMRAQAILYRRFRKELSPFKYAGYALLVETLGAAVEADDRPMLALCSELCYCTVQSSGLNVEELRRQGGLDTLGLALQRCVEHVMPDSTDADDEALAASRIMLTFAAAAAFEECRARIVEGLSEVVRSVVRCLALAHLPRVVESALECVCCFALDARLQATMHRLYVLHALVPRLFKYDYTLESAVSSGVDTSEANTQHALNVHAGLAVLAIARCAGGDPAVVPDPAVRLCARALVSQGMADLLGRRQTALVLRDLNSEIETPLLIWNVACRAEVLAWIEHNVPAFSSGAVLASDGIDGVDGGAGALGDDEGPNKARSFVFQTLARELQIGGVYVRVFNEQLRSHTGLPDPKRFCKDLVAYLLAAQAPAPEDAQQPEEERWQRVQMAAEALRNLLRANAGLEAGMADLLGRRQTALVLRDLNSEIETPLLIWNVACRAEVLAWIEHNVPAFSSGAVLASDGIDGVDGGAGALGDDEGPNKARSFVFQTLARELQIGGVYVRVFNEQLRSHTGLPDPKRFCKDLVAYLLAAQAPAPEDAQQPEEERWQRVQMAAEALRNLLRANAGLEAVLANRQDAAAVLGVLGPACDAAHVGTARAVLEVLALLTKNNDCLDAIAESGATGHLFPALHAAPGGAQTVELANAVISSMLGNSKLVASALAQGGLLYLLKVFASATERGAEITPRVHSALAIAKMSADLAHGSRVHILFARLAPPAFLSAMRQDAEAAVHMFEATHENPELIWNNNTRAQLREALDRLAADLYERQRRNRAEKWALPDDFAVVYDELKNEPTIGGVYTRLFLKQPTWALRNPKEFAEAVLTKYVELYNVVAKDGGSAESEEQLRYVSSVAQAFLAANAPVCDHAAKTGHLAKLLTQLDSASLPRRHPTCVAVVAILLSSQLCVEAAAAVPNAVRAMAGEALRVAPAAAVQGIERMFAKNACRESACLVAQLLAAPQVLDEMLGVLEGRHDFALGADASEVKARLVSGLQAAGADALHGEALRARLAQSKVWADYSGQRHDLFLPASQPVAGLLTGPTGAGASIGLLTNTPHSSQMMPDKPPEL